MNWLDPLRALARTVRNRWHGQLHRQMVAQAERLDGALGKLEQLDHRLSATFAEVERLRAVADDASRVAASRAAVSGSLLESVEQLLARRLAEQTSDLQDDAQRHAAVMAAISAPLLESVEQLLARRLTEQAGNLHEDLQKHAASMATFGAPLLESVEQLLSRRLAELSVDVQDHLLLNAASIVAQVYERLAAQGAKTGELRPFSRDLPAPPRAA